MTLSQIRFLDVMVIKDNTSLSTDLYRRPTDRNTLLGVKEKTERVPSCFTQYSPLGKAFKDIIRKHWYIIDTDPQLKPIFKYPPRVVFKKTPNQKRETFLDKVPEGNYKSGQCVQCSFTYKCNSFTHPHTGQRFKIKGLITCMSTNVVYMLKCPCGLFYIEKARRSLKTRI
ncbi:unnamed protein product, partial [Coregonus sp. 'balchen']